MGSAACILDGIPLDIGQFMVFEMKFFRNRGGTHIFFPSLITEHYSRAGVDE